MPRVVVPRKRIADGSLPSVCVVCGREAPHRLYPRVSAPSAGCLRGPLLALLGFWLYAVRGRSPAGDDAPAGLPFCDRHRGYWARRGWFIVTGFVVLAALFAAALAADPDQPAPGANNGPHWLWGLAGMWMLVFLPAFLIVHLLAVRPTASGPDAVALAGASRGFASALEENLREEGRGRRSWGRRAQDG